MKKVLIIIFTILCVVCVSIDIWCLVVYQFGEEKVVSNTVELDLQETADGDEKKAFMEINYFKNSNKNGLELFEIKYNYFMDETLNEIVSVGSQYVADTKEDKLAWNYTNMVDYHITAKERFGILNIGLRYVYDTYFAYELVGNSSYYEYQSPNDFEFSIGNDINPMNDASMFKITIGDEIYGMKFKQDFTVPDYFIGTASLETAFTQDINHCYPYINHNFMAYKICESLRKAIVVGNSYQVLQFGDFFDYYKYDGKVYSPISDIDNSKITTEFNNFYVVKINISNDGARVATDSLFNQVQGNASFNLTGGHVYENYYYGRNVITLTASDFNYILVEDKFYKLALSDKFKKAYEEYANGIVLDITIDLDKLSAHDIEFAGFENGTFGEFDIYRCVTTQLVDGESVETEVLYA